MEKGKKHTLLFYHRTMDRLWRGTAVLSLELFFLWWFGSAFTALYRPQLDPVLLGAAGYSAVLSLFAFLTRRMSYVRASENFLLVATPFFRFKTSYKRIKGVRSVEFHRLYSPANLSWAEDHYTAPMIGETAVVIKLKDFPVSPGLLGLFFPKFLVSEKETELVLLVPDWMAFSLELDSRYAAYQQRLANKARLRALRAASSV